MDGRTRLNLAHPPLGQEGGSKGKALQIEMVLVVTVTRPTPRLVPDEVPMSLSSSQTDCLEFFFCLPSSGRSAHAVSQLRRLSGDHSFSV